MKLMLNFLMITLTVMTVQVWAGVKIAVIDSGTDVKHEALAGKMWINPVEDPATPRDDDGNDYPNDINGWNFAESNNQLIDYSYKNLYEQTDLFKYFEVQKRQIQNRTTDADRQWLLAKRSDSKFMSSMSTFGNFVHGTHVSAITTKYAMAPEVIGIKLLPTKVGLAKLASMASPEEKSTSVSRGWGKKNPTPQTSGKRIDLIKALIKTVAVQNATMLNVIGEYVKFTEADAANGSFGVGSSQAKMMTGIMFKVLFFRAPIQEEHELLMKFFLQEVTREQKTFVNASPDTLFVFAAGNDGTDNDIFPSAPASVNLENSIAVAASYGNVKLAPFSNYGKTSVDLAAPGVFIKSAIPVNKYLEVSGTSQASPLVAAAAAKVREVNPKLTPNEVKKILMATVDFKDYLKEKVISGGVLNHLRAAHAADYSRGSSLDEAILVSRLKVKDLPTDDPTESKGSVASLIKSNDNGSSAATLTPIAMTSIFDITE